MSGLPGDGLHMRTSVETSLWPLRLQAAHDRAVVACAECGVPLLVTLATGRPSFVLADLTARAEEHITRCFVAGRRP